jgi:predicted amidohydrolase YtcJ
MTLFADIIISNVNVFTSDDSNPSAEAVAVRGNQIVFIGSNQDVSGWRGRSTRVVDGGGKTLLPGFIDCHFHLLMGSLALDDLQVEAVKSYAEFKLRLSTYAKEHPNKPWLTGFGLHYNLGPGHTQFDRHQIDAIIADRPVYIISYDFHTAWVNTIALEKAGIFLGADCGTNSEIVLDECGEATGELREAGAMEKIERLFAIPDRAEKGRLLKQGLKLASSLGITSVHNMDGDAEQAALYADFERSGELTTRVYIPYSVTPNTPFESLEKEAAAMMRAYRSGLVRSGFIKMFMDGVIESYTGLLVDDYADRPGSHGTANYEVEHFRRMIAEADRLGLQISIHSVGDGGVRGVLDAYETALNINGLRDHRHRIEHIELIHSQDVSRFAGMGVIASMQPLHAPPNADGSDVWQARVGEERWQFSFAWTTLRSSGAHLVFGSDWPVASPNPLAGIHNTLNRIPWKEGLPHHRQTLKETLKSYTCQAAYAEFEENRKGKIKSGFLADLVLLSEDIFQAPPEDVKNIHPLLTIMDGRIVYEA